MGPHMLENMCGADVSLFQDDLSHHVVDENITWCVRVTHRSDYWQGQPGCYVAMCQHHTVTKRGCLRVPSAVHVLLLHSAIGVLHQENHMGLLDFELNRNESLLHTDDISVPVDDGADSNTPAPSGAPSCFRSSVRTRVCQLTNARLPSFFISRLT